jgi:hypothetical protein
MNTPMPNKKRLVIVGASGMVGGYALRFALEDSAVISVMAIGRRPLGISHPKLNEVIHQDFSDCSGLAETLSGQDAAIFCLGAYTGAVSDTQLREVTVDYPIEFARVLHLSSPDSAMSIYSDLHTFTLWNPAKSRILATESCARSIPCCGLFSQAK